MLRILLQCIIWQVGQTDNRQGLVKGSYSSRHYSASEKLKVGKKFMKSGDLTCFPHGQLHFSRVIKNASICLVSSYLLQGNKVRV